MEDVEGNFTPVYKYDHVLRDAVGPNNGLVIIIRAIEEDVAVFFKVLRRLSPIEMEIIQKLSTDPRGTPASFTPLENHMDITEDLEQSDEDVQCDVNRLEAAGVDTDVAELRAIRKSVGWHVSHDPSSANYLIAAACKNNIPHTLHLTRI